MLVTSHLEIDRVYNAIFQAIFERRVEPNTRLIETKLAKALSTSRSNIRMALLLLEQRKLVDFVPNKGAIVADPSEKDAAEVFAARLHIEMKVLDLVYEQLKAKDLKQLHTHLSKEKQAWEKQDRHQLLDLTGRFHLLLAQIAKNQVLLDFLSYLVARSSLILEKYELKEQNNCSNEDHSELVHFIANGDREMAQTLLAEHLKAVEQSLNFSQNVQTDDLWDVFASMLG